MTRPRHGLVLAPRAGLPVALSFGMGLDSMAILARWLTEPGSRDFALDQLTVVTAMTGDEPDVTRRLMQTYALPLMAAHRVRYVQIARATHSGGYVVLDDSRTPRRMIMRGPCRLSPGSRRRGESGGGRNTPGLDREGYCPFAGTRHDASELAARWRAEPDVGVQALALEYTALALNPRSRLFGTRSAHQLVRAHGLTEVWCRFERHLAARSWALYEVRRIVYPRRDDPTGKGPAWRSVRTRYGGDHATAQHILARVADAAGRPVEVDEHGITRVELISRDAGFPALEHQLVLAPTGVVDKQRAGFEAAWQRLRAQPQAAAPARLDSSARR